MSNAIAVVAESGFGKSTSIGNIPELGIEGLDPKETFIFNVKGKQLPFRGWQKQYIPIDMDEPPTVGNYLSSVNTADIIKVMKFINDSRPDIKNVVLDDFQYTMAQQFMNDALKSGFDKFNKLAKNAYDLIDTGINLREDINFIILTHSDSKETAYETVYKIKTIGKMLDDKVTLEGLFTVILYGKQEYDDKNKKVIKNFVTNFDGQYPAKSPVGMFKDTYIPNDMGMVVKEIKSYYSGE